MIKGTRDKRSISKDSMKSIAIRFDQDTIDQINKYKTISLKKTGKFKSFAEEARCLIELGLEQRKLIDICAEQGHDWGSPVHICMDEYATKCNRCGHTETYEKDYT